MLFQTLQQSTKIGFDLFADFHLDPGSYWTGGGEAVTEQPLNNCFYSLSYQCPIMKTCLLLLFNSPTYILSPRHIYNEVRNRGCLKANKGVRRLVARRL